MGIIKAAAGSVGGALADQWLEVIEPIQMDNNTILSSGTLVRKNDRRSSNKKRTEDVISNGSVIHVPENTFMMLIDGGKIVAMTDEAGYYRVDNSTSPSLFYHSSEGAQTQGFTNTDEGRVDRPGGFLNSIKDSFERFKFGGVTPYKQKVVYVNRQEIVGIRFGTKTPVSYTDRVLAGRPVACKVTSYGQYSIKIADPILFYKEVGGKSASGIFEVRDMASQYIDEFLGSYATALARLSLENMMVTDIQIRQSDLSKYMAEVLDEDWLRRGIAIESVGIASVSFDDRTNDLLDQFNKDTILLSPEARAARLAGGYAAGLEAAGSNANGAMMGFAGMAMGVNAGMGAGMHPNQAMQQGGPSAVKQEYARPSEHSSTLNTGGNAGGWTCSCGNQMPDTANFCTNCGSKKPEDKGNWTCSCGSVNTTQFCPKCGTKKPEEGQQVVACSKCGYQPEDPKFLPVFCPECGNRFSE